MRARLKTKLFAMGRYYRGMFISLHAAPIHMRVRTIIAFNYGNDYVGSVEEDAYAHGRRIYEKYVSGHKPNEEPEYKVDFYKLTGKHSLRMFNIFHWPATILGTIRAVFVGAVDHADAAIQRKHNQIEEVKVESSAIAIGIKFIFGIAFGIATTEAAWFLISKTVGDFVDLVCAGIASCCCASTKVAPITVTKPIPQNAAQSARTLTQPQPPIVASHAPNTLGVSSQLMAAIQAIDDHPKSSRTHTPRGGATPVRTAAPAPTIAIPTVPSTPQQPPFDSLFAQASPVTATTFNCPSPKVSEHYRLGV